jgi:hypothetical protein
LTNHHFYPQPLPSVPKFSLRWSIWFSQFIHFCGRIVYYDKVGLICSSLLN